MPAYGQNNCILKTIRFENIELIREHLRVLEQTSQIREHSRVSRTCTNPAYNTQKLQIGNNVCIYKVTCMHLQSYMYTFTKLQ